MQKNTNIIRVFLDEKNWRLWLLIYATSAILPFLCTILLVKKSNICGLIIAIYFTCLFFLIIITILFIKKFKSPTAKLIPPILSILILVIFYKSYATQSHLADVYFFYTRAERLENFVKEINSQDNIYEMNDGLRKTAYVNNIESGNLNAEEFKYELRKEKIDIEMYFAFAEKLRDMDLYNFEKKDASVYFIVDYFFIHASGIAYSTSGIKPKMIFSTSVINWEHLEGNWYMFSI